MGTKYYMQNKLKSLKMLKILKSWQNHSEQLPGKRDQYLNTQSNFEDALNDLTSFDKVNFDNQNNSYNVVQNQFTSPFENIEKEQLWDFDTEFNKSLFDSKGRKPADKIFEIPRRKTIGLKSPLWISVHCAKQCLERGFSL